MKLFLSFMALFGMALNINALEIPEISAILRSVEWILHNIGCVEWDSPI